MVTILVRYHYHVLKNVSKYMVHTVVKYGNLQFNLTNYYNILV